MLESGEVFGWGYNGNGQLGIGNNVNQVGPCRVIALQGIVITKVKNFVVMFPSISCLKRNNYPCDLEGICVFFL